MPAPDPFLLFAKRFRGLEVPYMIKGGVAAIFYGEPRLTNDVDIVAALRLEDFPALEAAFPADEFYRPPREVFLIETGRSRRGHFNLIHHASGFKADVYLAGDDPLHAWALGRARREVIEGEEVSFAPPEFVILKKLQFYREGESSKHLRDIQRMPVAMGESWDRSELLRRVEELGLQPEWARVLGPPVS